MFISDIVPRVSIEAEAVEIDLDVIRLATQLHLLPTADVAKAHRLKVPVAIKARVVEMKLIITDPAIGADNRFDTALIKAIVRSNDWWRRLLTGESALITEIALEEGYSQRLIGRHLALAFLNPRVTQLHRAHC